jgi:hypothetical protein
MAQLGEPLFGPVCFPAIKIGLSFLETLEAKPLERRPLRVAQALESLGGW